MLYILTRSRVDVTAASQERVNSASRKLLATLKEEKLVLDWRKRQQTRADVKVTIEKVLDDMLPPAYTPEVFEKKTSAVFQHIYEAYFGAGQSVYATS